jgi:hypothetical protein
MMGMGGGSNGGGHMKRCPLCGGLGAVPAQPAQQAMPPAQGAAPMADALQRAVVSRGGSGGGGMMGGGGGGHGGHR